MTFPIQTVPAGLLSALGMTGYGAPKELQETISCNLDGTPFWLARKLEHLGGTVAGTFTGPGVGVTEPITSGEAWWMVGGTLALGPMVAGESVVSSFAIRNLDGNTTRIATSVSRATVDAAGLASWGFQCPQPFMLMPGTALIGLIEDENVAAARGISIAALGYRFTV